eukprot:3517840-Amphidinium_carterae.1
MKAHLKQADVDSGRTTVDDFQGHQQADIRSSQPRTSKAAWAPRSKSCLAQLAGLCDEGAPLLEAGWTTTLWTTREKQRSSRLPVEPPVPLPAAPARVPATDAPFQLGEHQLVVKHDDFLQCLDCHRQAGKVKATGEYNFAYMRTQD